MNVDLIGYAHTPFGKLPGAEVEALMREAGAQRVRTVRDLSNRDRVVTGVKNILGKAAAIG